MAGNSYRARKSSLLVPFPKCKSLITKIFIVSTYFLPYYENLWEIVPNNLLANFSANYPFSRTEAYVSI